MLRTRWMLVVAAIGMSAFTPIVHAADTISGYGLYKSTSRNWAWDPVQDTGTIASGGEAGRLVFTLPRTVFPSWPDNARVGIVSGIFGTPARCWVSRSQPFQVDPNVQSPWASNLVAGSALYSAKLLGGGEGEDIQLGTAVRCDAVASLGLGPLPAHRQRRLGADGLSGRRLSDPECQSRQRRQARAAHVPLARHAA